MLLLCLSVFIAGTTIFIGIAPMPWDGAEKATADAEVTFSQSSNLVAVTLEAATNTDKIVIMDSTGSTVETSSGNEAAFDSPEQQAGQSLEISPSSIRGDVLVVTVYERENGSGRIVAEYDM